MATNSQSRKLITPSRERTLITPEYIAQKQAEAAQSAIKTVDEEIKKLNLPENTDVSKYGTYDTEISKTTRAKELYDSLSTYLSGLKVTNTGLKSSIDEINKSIQQNSAYYGGLSDYFNKAKDYYSKYKDEEDYNQKVIIPQKQNEEWASADTEALKLELDDLESKYNSYKALKNKRDGLYRTIVSAWKRAGYSSERAENKALSDGRIVKYDKELSQYGQYGDISKTLSDKKQFYNNATRIQEGIALRDNAINALDFEEKSHYIVDTAKSDTGYDLTYEFIVNMMEKNGNNKMSGEEHRKKARFGNYGETTGYNYLTDEEIKIYKYYYTTEGKEKAEEFLDSIQETLNYRKAGIYFEGIEGKTGKELAFGVRAGFDQFQSGLKNLFNTSDDYVPSSSTQMLSAMVREDLEDSGAKILGSSVGQIGYDLVNTTSNMLPSILASTVVGWVNPAAGAAVGASLMGGSAAGNAYSEMLNLGYDKEQARGYSILVGASEATLQYVLGGISSLGGTATKNLTSKIATKLASKVDNVIAKIAINTGTKLVGSMVSEFGEEYLQEVLTPLFKNITLNTEEDVDLLSEEALYAGILGALSAGLLEGGSTVSSEIGTYKSGKYVMEKGELGSLVELGKTYSPGTEAYNLASQVNENTDAYTVGQLLQEVGAESLTESNVADIEKSLVRKSVLPEDAKTIAKWIYKASQGEVLTRTQQSAIYNNPDIVTTLKEVAMNPKSTVNQRTQGYQELIDNLERGPTASKEEVASDEATPTASEEETKQKPVMPYSAEQIESKAKEFEAMGMSPEAANAMAVAQVSAPAKTNSLPTVETTVKSQKITADMTDAERYSILKDTKIVAINDSKSKTQPAYTEIEKVPETAKGQIEKLIKEFADDLDIFNVPLSTTALDIEFQLSKNNGLRESLSQQLKYGGNFHDFSKALINLREILKVAVLVDAHTEDRYKGTAREDINFEAGYVLLSAFKSDGYVIPVKLEIKQKKDVHNILYVVVSMTKIKGTSVMESALTDTEVSSIPLSDTDSVYSLPHLVSKINPKDKDFLKYLPDQMLNAEQIAAKRLALKNDKEKLEAIPKKKESALLMPQKDGADTDNSSDESMLTEPTVKKAEADPVRDSVFELSGKKPYTPEQLKVMAVARRFGRKVIFEDTTKTQGFKSDGYYDDDGNIHLDYNNVKPLEWILKHELTHFGEGTDAYNEYVDLLRKTKAYKEWLQKELRTDEESLGKLEGLMRQKIMKEREAVAPLNPIEAQAEIIADFSATFAFAKDSRGIEALTADMSLKEHNAFVQFLIDFISYLKKKLGGSNKTLTYELSVLEDRYLKMLTYKAQNPTTNNDSGNKYSISYTTDNSPVAVIEKDILEGVPQSKWIDTVKNTISGNFANGIPIGNRLIKVNAITRNEFTNSKYSKGLKTSDGTVYADKFKSANNLDDIVLASTNYINEDLKHQRKDNFKEFARGDVLLQIGNNKYSAKVIVGLTTNNNMVLYDIVEFTPTNFALKKEDESIGYAKTAGSLRYDSSSNNNVPQNEPVVNNNSMQEADKYSQENISEEKNNGNKYSISVENENDGVYNDEEDNSISEEESYALISYKSSESYKINAALRDNEELSDSDMELINDLDSALSKLPVYKGEVYRNIGFDDFGGKEAFDDFLIEHEEGNYITYKAYTSASTREDGYEVDGEYTVKIIINSINARDVDGYGNNFESEVIFPRRSKYVVDKVVYDSNGHPIIYLTEVTNNGKGNNGQLYSEKRSEAVQPMQESHSRNGDLQGLSSNDSRRDSLRRSGLQGISTQRIDSKVQYSIPTEADELLDRYESGEISRDEYKAELDELFNQAVDTFGDNKQNGNKYSISVNNGNGAIYNGIERYTEKQYNDYGWIAVNKVLTGKELTKLYTRFAEIKLNKKYNYRNKLGEYVIPVGDAYGAVDKLVYIKGTNKHPIIRQVVEILDAYKEFSVNIADEVIKDENKGYYYDAFESYEAYAGETIFRRITVFDTPSYSEHRNKARGHNGKGTSKNYRSGYHRNGVSQDSTKQVQSENGSIKFSGQDSEESNSENASKNQYSIPTEADELLDRYESGEISREEFMSEVDELYNRGVDTFGPIKRGEKAQNETNVPRRVEKNKNTHRFVRTIIESDALTDEMLDDHKADIILGNFAYESVSDEAAMKKADQYIKNGRAESVWDSAVNGSPVHISKETIAVGEKLLMEAVENNDRKRALELSGELCDVLTRAGQVVQAGKMLKQMTGLGKLMTVQRMVKTINKDLAEKYGEDKVPLIRIDEVLAEQLASLKPGQEYEIVYRNIMEDVAVQMPSTFLDKWNAWRYFAMLANPRTHIRNLMGNAIFVPAVRIGYFMSASFQAAFVHDTSKRTKSVFIKPEYKAFAEEDIKKREAKAMLSGNGQLDDRSSLEAMKKIFKTEWLDKKVKGNSDLMEAEDMFFKSIHYRHALAGFLQARKVDLKNVDEKTLNEAREYAVNEAKKATFQEFSYAAEMLNHLRLPENLRKNAVGKAVDFTGQVLIGGLLPFKRTPINIIKRGIEYSPLGLAQTTIRGLYQVCKGDFNVSQFCDGLAANLTGTGLLMLGMLLCSQGLVTGGFGDDEEDRIKKLNGEQEYSVQIFGKSFTIDWAAPACIPFFIGVEVLNAFKDTEDFKLSSITKAVWNALEPITNLSMLSGIQSVISSAAYADDSQKLAAIVSDVALSYISQGIPSILGATARTIDSTQRSWFNDKNSQFDTYAQTLGNTVASKVPGLSYLQVPSFDEWGRPKSRGGFGERALENFISPGYFSSIQYDEVETELKDVFEATGERSFPTTAEKSFKVNGETKYLTAEEYVVYAQAKGEMSYEYAQEFVNSAQYKKLTDAEKAKVIGNLYKYATAKAKTQVSDYDITDSFKTVSNWEKNGKSVVTYYIGRALDN